MIIRIRFKSGNVAEERGDLSHIAALISDDKAGLIDYVMGLDPETGEFDNYVHEHDPAWN